ncbi:MAG: hypothetical protein WCT42_03100 [Candidatus Paceibacterota bacterium]
MQEYLQTIKKTVEQIVPKTGVSCDYSNQINGIVSFYKLDLNFLKNILREKPYHMKRYEEVYKDCGNIITEKNRNRIKRLDELAEQMNEILKNPDSINEISFVKTCNEIYFQIYGDDIIKV